MGCLTEWMDNILNLGDPEVRTWFLVRQKHLPFILTGFYVFFTMFLGPAVMKNRKPFELRNIMIVFNLFLVFIYFSFLILIGRHVSSFTFDQHCHGVDVKKGDLTYTLATHFWIIYLVKYVELLDTVFFILRKKQNQVTFLHVIHHSLVPICGWILMRTETSAMMAVPVVMNCVVHVIMYSYYGLSAMGPQVRKYLWWKKYLTQLQMLQFFLIIVFASILAPLSGCRMMITSYFMVFTIVPLFFYLFYIFYKRSFQLHRTANGRIREDVLNHDLQGMKLNKSAVVDHMPRKLE